MQISIFAAFIAGLISFLMFIAFCMMASGWSKTDSTVAEGVGSGNPGVAIACSFLSVFSWAALCYVSYKGYKEDEIGGGGSWFLLSLTLLFPFIKFNSLFFTITMQWRDLADTSTPLPAITAPWTLPFHEDDYGVVVTKTNNCGFIYIFF